MKEKHLFGQKSYESPDSLLKSYESFHGRVPKSDFAILIEGLNVGWSVFLPSDNGAASCTRTLTCATRLPKAQSRDRRAIKIQKRCITG